VAAKYDEKKPLIGILHQSTDSVIGAHPTTNAESRPSQVMRWIVGSTAALVILALVVSSQGGVTVGVGRRGHTCAYGATCQARQFVAAPVFAALTQYFPGTAGSAQGSLTPRAVSEEADSLTIMLRPTGAVTITVVISAHQPIAGQVAVSTAVDSRRGALGGRATVVTATHPDGVVAAAVLEGRTDDDLPYAAALSLVTDPRIAQFA
jgi:hypothetical protein